MPGCYTFRPYLHTISIDENHINSLSERLKSLRLFPYPPLFLVPHRACAIIEKLICSCHSPSSCSCWRYINAVWLSLWAFTDECLYWGCFCETECSGSWASAVSRLSRSPCVRTLITPSSHHNHRAHSVESRKANYWTSDSLVGVLLFLFFCSALMVSYRPGIAYVLTTYLYFVFTKPSQGNLNYRLSGSTEYQEYRKRE